MRVESDPIRQLHDASSRADVDQSERAHEILVGLGPRRSDVNGEMPNVSIALENENCEASRVLAADPPLGERAVIMDGDDEQFGGVIEAITLSDDSCTIEVQS